MQGVGWHVHRIIDFQGRLPGGLCGKAIGQAQARAVGKLLGGVGGRNGVYPADDEALGLFEESGVFRRFDGQRHADLAGGSFALGDFQARAQGLVVEIEFGEMAARQVRSTGAPRELQDGLGRRGRGELHGQRAVFEFDGLQFGGGVNDVLGVGECGTFAAKTRAAQREVQGQPKGLMRREMHIFNFNGTFGEGIPGAQRVLERLAAFVSDGDRGSHAWRAGNQFRRRDTGRQLARRDPHGVRAFRPHAGQQAPPMPQQGGVAAQSCYGGPLVAI